MPGPGMFLFGDEERKELLDVMESGYLNRYGKEDDVRFKKKVVTFEKEFAEYCESKYAVAVNGGTTALLTCLSALGIGPGDEVIVTGYTYIASIAAIVFAGAIPVLADINDTLNVDPADIRKKITPRTKALMPVHMLGNQCEMDEIMTIAKEHNLYVIEDSCQALGATYKGKKIGSMGNIAAFSLNLQKTITTGDGGVVVTNDFDLYERSFGFHDQGHKPNRLNLEIGKRSFIGLNLRINELTGAVALAQTRKLNSIVTTLRRNKARLKNAISSLEGFKFRRITDPEGEAATLLVMIFDTVDLANKFCQKTGCTPIATSGWHIYSNMEQLLQKKHVSKWPNPDSDVQYYAGMLPQLDDLVTRAVPLSVGVCDPGLGAGFGISVLSTDEEIDAVAANIRKVIKEIV